jgi:alpha-tubulin suppressor-like RCC1 family protein
LKACNGATDCQSMLCTSQVCQVPTCADNVKNGGEGDVDCGGASCPKCAAGESCGSNADCVSEACNGAKCLGILQIAAGSSHACALSNDGRVFCWGVNGHGQLGDGTTTGRTKPTLVSGITTAKAIALGGDPKSGTNVGHTCALLQDSSVHCWGEGAAGQLGNGTTVEQHFPYATGLTGVAEIAAGGKHTCARLANDTVMCWGSNAGSGQIGYGIVSTQVTTPTVMTLVGVPVGLALGAQHTCIRMSDLTVQCTGDGTSGELGLGDTTDRLAPVVLAGLANVSQVAAGAFFTCGLLADANVQCWGANNQYQLGLGDNLLRSLPAPVAALSNVKLIALGSDGAVSTAGGHTCALLLTGAVQCWGNNTSGQVGNGNQNTPVLPPTIVNGLADVAEIDLGSSFSCARLGSGALRCWGRNDQGQVGNGTKGATPVLTPTAVVWP